MLLRTAILHNIVAGSPCVLYKDSRFEDYHMISTLDDIGSKRTNHKFGYFGEVCQSNILIPIKDSFYLKMCTPFFSFRFSKSVGGDALAPQPLPLLGP